MDRELYLPDAWAKDHDRRREAGVPEDVGFRSKAELALGMLQRAVDTGFPFTWVTGDAAYGGHPPLRVWLERLGLPYVLGVESTEKFWTWPHSGSVPSTAESLAGLTPASGWRLLSSDEGGPATHEWNRVAVRPVGNPGPGGWLLWRRSPTRRQRLDFHACFGPPGTTLEELVGLVGTQSTAKECCEEAKHGVGLGQYEVRNWEGWYRHMTLCMLAQAFLTVEKSKDGDTGEITSNGLTHAGVGSGSVGPAEKWGKVVAVA